ncbi:MAG: hypothetical protein U0414_36910 [Polyangiaceae bacterium]
MKRLRWLALPALAATTFGCDLVLGLDEYTEGAPTGSGGSTSATGTSTSSTDTATTGASSGGASSCTPGTDYPCYEGPAMTENVGTCHGGMHTCKADGETYTPCVQQVVPTSETCRDDKQDEDCDHAECVLQAHLYGGTGFFYAGAIAIDGMGNTIVGGTYNGTITFDALHVLAGPGSTFVAKFDPKGEPIWAKDLGDAGVSGLAVDTSGSIFVTGTWHQGTVDAGGPTFECQALGACAYAVKLSSSGTHVFTAMLDLGESTDLSPPAVDGFGNVYLWGTVESLQTGVNFWLRKLTGSGTLAWHKNYTASTTNPRRAGGVVVNPVSGNIHVVGAFKGSEVLGVGTAVTSAGGYDVIIGEVNSGGTTLNKKTLGDNADQFADDVRADTQGNIYVTGGFAGKIQASSTLQSAGSLDTYVLRVNTNGQYGWAKSFGGAGDQTPSGIAVQPGTTPTVVFTGVSSGNIDFGGGLLMAGGGEDIYLAKLDAADGSYRWSRLFGDLADQTSTGVGVAPDGESRVSMSTAGTVNFGGDNLSSSGMNNAVWATFGP